MGYQRGTRYRSRRPATLASLAVFGVLGALSIGYGCHKRSTELNMPINKTLPECRELMLSSDGFEMREIPFSWGNRYNIVASGERIGTVVEEPFNWGKKFKFYAGTEEQGEYLGYAQEKVLSWGHQSTVYNEKGETVGRLDEKVLTLNPGHLIEVFNEADEKVAVSDEKAFSWTHATDIYDGTGKRKIGSTTKAIMWDDYTLEMIDWKVDKRLLFALVAMEDKLEDEAKAESSSDD